MKKTIVAFASVAMLVCASSAANATLIAGWNFNDPAPSDDTPLAATVGVGTLSFDGWGGGVTNFGGTTVNALDPPNDAAGRDLALQGNPGGSGAAPFLGNGTWVDFEISMAGKYDLELTYAQQRSATGFTSNVWSYSIDGGATFDDVQTFTFPGGSGTATSYAANGVFTVDFSGIPAVNFEPNVIVRLTLDGATAAGGNNRFDNVQFHAIPEPAGIVLMMVGLAAVGAMRRRS